MNLTIKKGLLISCGLFLLTSVLLIVFLTISMSGPPSLTKKQVTDDIIRMLPTTSGMLRGKSKDIHNTIKGQRPSDAIAERQHLSEMIRTYSPTIRYISKPVDGFTVVSIEPLVREFPNLLVYKFDDQSKAWSRVTEGVVLGVQYEPSSRYDLHLAGEAFDEDLLGINQADVAKRTEYYQNRDIVTSAYDTFLHVHMGGTKRYFIEKREFQQIASRLIGKPDASYSDHCLIYDAPLLDNVHFSRDGGFYKVEAFTDNNQLWSLRFLGSDGNRLHNKSIDASWQTGLRKSNPEQNNQQNSDTLDTTLISNCRYIDGKWVTPDANIANTFKKGGFNPKCKEYYKELPMYWAFDPFVGFDNDNTSSQLTRILHDATANDDGCDEVNVKGFRPFKSNICDSKNEDIKKLIATASPSFDRTKLFLWKSNFTGKDDPSLVVGYVIEKTNGDTYTSFWVLVRNNDYRYVPFYVGTYLAGSVLKIEPFGPNLERNALFIKYLSCTECEPFEYVKIVASLPNTQIIKVYTFDDGNLEYSLPGNGHSIDADVETKIMLSPNEKSPWLMQHFRRTDGGEDEWWAGFCKNFKCNTSVTFGNMPKEFTTDWQNGKRL